MLCGSCEVDLPDEMFNLNRNRPRGRQSHCKSCVCLYDKIYHRNRYDSGIKREQFKVNRERNRQFIFEYLKSHPCNKCSETDPVVLEFDHLTDDKVENISHMILGAWSLDKINVELSKCQVLCANCHRRKTAEQFNFWILKYI